MEVIEVTKNNTYPNARELPCSRERPSNKQVGRKSGGNAGTRTRRHGYLPPARPADQKASQEATAANKRVLHIDGNGKRHFIKAA